VRALAATFFGKAVDVAVLTGLRSMSALQMRRGRERQYSIWLMSFLHMPSMTLVILSLAT
jgi:hypothetical protein